MNIADIAQGIIAIAQASAIVVKHEPDKADAIIAAKDMRELAIALDLIPTDTIEGGLREIKKRYGE
jgi:hypothetical protein